jgi:preprotein translocase subunit YajC
VTILSSSRHHYVAKISIFLITVALIAGMVGCGGAEYYLTIASTAGGSVTTPGEAGPYTYDGRRVVNLVTEAEEGYHFVNWTGDVGTIADVEAASTTITMNDNYSITANFELEPGWYSLTISSTEGGSVTLPGEGTSIHAATTVVNLVATPASGYQFVNWTGNVGTIANVNAASTIITMNSNYSITANFVEIPEYNLTISSTTEGWLLCGNVTTPGEGTFIYSSGTVVNLVAQAEEGCHFVGWTGDVGTIADVNAATTTINMNGDYSIRANFRPYFSPMVAAGADHTVGLKWDGTVVAVGDNPYGQCSVGGWTNIIQVAAGSWHTVGLRADGTVVAVGWNYHGQCNVGGWTDIVQVAAGSWHTVGLRADGTVVAIGNNAYGQCNVGTRSWTNIIRVAAGSWHTVGLRADGTVVAVGYNAYGHCDVIGWTNIIQVVAGSWHTVGLRADGTVVAAGDIIYGQCDVGGWTNTIQVATGYFYTVGLLPFGTVVAVGDNPYGQCDVGGWTNIVDVSAGWRHTVGLNADGTVVAVGSNALGQCNVGGWDLF